MLASDVCIPKPNTSDPNVLILTPPFAAVDVVGVEVAVVGVVVVILLLYLCVVISCGLHVCACVCVRVCVCACCCWPTVMKHTPTNLLTTFVFTLPTVLNHRGLCFTVAFHIAQDFELQAIVFSTYLRVHAMCGLRF